jgi:hypothetical protein
VRKISLREAAKMFDVSRPTLQKALKEGKISGQLVGGDGSENGRGQWQVDVSELARVYRPRSPDPVKVSQGGKSGLSISDNPLPVNAEAELAAIRAEFEAKLEAERERRQAAEVRAAVAEAVADERLRSLEHMQRMLPPPDAPRAEPERRRWWFLK